MIYLNQALKQYFTTGIDNNNVKSIKLKWINPDQEIGEITTGIEIEESATGEYYVELENDFLDVVGVWTLWAEITDVDDNVFPGTPFQIVVSEEGTGQTPVTLEGIKSYLAITTTDKDEEIKALIPMLIQKYLEIRNAPFKTVGDVTIYPEGMEYVIAQMYKYISNKSGDALSESIGNYSITNRTNYMGFPSSITSLIKKYSGRVI